MGKEVAADASMDEKIGAVADHVEEAALGRGRANTAMRSLIQSDVTTTLTGRIIEELRKMAVAAKNNQRQQLLVSARTISQLIQEIWKELRKLSGKCQPLSDPWIAHTQDRIIKNGQALRNYATQLKILASVKAASSEPDSDADDQLITVIRSLGSSLA